MIDDRDQVPTGVLAAYAAHLSVELEVVAFALERVEQLADPHTYSGRIEAAAYAHALVASLREVVSFFSDEDADTSPTVGDYVPGGASGGFDAASVAALRDRLEVLERHVWHAPTDRLEPIVAIGSADAVGEPLDRMLARLARQADPTWAGSFHRSLAAARKNVRTADVDGTPRDAC